MGHLSFTRSIPPADSPKVFRSNVKAGTRIREADKLLESLMKTPGETIRLGHWQGASEAHHLKVLLNRAGCEATTRLERGKGYAIYAKFTGAK